MVRLFTAIQLPETQKEVLLSMMGGLPHARWQGKDQLHLTLRFIGEVDKTLAEEIRLLLFTISFSPFHLCLQGLGLFGSKRKPRMIWVGVEKPEPVISLSQKITNSLRQAGLPPENRKFKAHVSLARIKGNNGLKLPWFLEEHQGFGLDPFKVTAFTLVQSHLSHTGADYKIIERYPAKGTQ